MLLTPVVMTSPPPPLHWINPADRRLQYRGRWWVQKERALAVNTGSQLQARFSGDWLALRFDASAYPHEPPQLWVRLDLQPWQKMEVAPLIELAPDPPHFEHLLRIVLRFDTSGYPHEPPQLWVRLDMEPWQAIEVAPEIELTPPPPHAEHLLQVVFKGAREWDNRWKTPLQTAVVLTGIGLAEGGKLLDPPPRPALRIEFLGDSITEGVLLHRLDRPFPEAWPERADGRLGYAFQTGERLGADTRVVGFGRQGVTIEGNGGVPPAPDAFAWICEGVPKDDWQPHLVVINQGTNDGAVPSGRFRPAYDRYLSLVRAGYPAAHIFALRPFSGAHADDIRAVVEQQMMERAREQAQPPRSSERAPRGPAAPPLAPPGAGDATSPRVGKRDISESGGEW